MYSSNVLSTLYAAGWTPDRKVSTAQWVNQLEFEGFVMLPSAIDILERFGGLETRPQKTSSDVFLPGVLRFDPLLAASGEFDRVDYWQN